MLPRVTSMTFDRQFFYLFMLLNQVDGLRQYWFIKSDRFFALGLKFYAAS